MEHTDELYLESCEKLDTEKAQEQGLSLEEFYQIQEDEEYLKYQEMKNEYKTNYFNNLDQ